tara:strand:+ start:16709 stop:17011 length:303 start_codon:yes stop_codon:yes gene_type:complete
MREAHNSELCPICQINATYNKPLAENMADEDVLQHHIFDRVRRGCRECGSREFGYFGGIKIENKLKWYVLQVACEECNKTYDDILEVRVINEPKEKSKSK